MTRKSLVLLSVAMLGLVSCKRFVNPFAGERVLAEVGDARLYDRDVVSIYTSGMTSADSAKTLQGYVDQWVKKQLKVQEAERLFHSSQRDIDRMVDDYRNSLLIHKIDQYYVDTRLDTLFTDQQIQEYYEQHKADFVLDKTLVRARVVRFPDTYRQSAKLKELMLSSREQDSRDFVELCAKNGFELTELNQWSDFSALLALLPTSPDADYSYVLSEGKIHEFSNQDSRFYVRVLDCRRPGDYAPLESVTDMIRRMVFNGRREEIIRRHEDSLYRQALSEKEMIINVK